MLHREVIIVCSEIHSKHTLWTEHRVSCLIPKFRNATIIFVVCVRPSAVVEQLCTNRKDFYKIWYFGIYRKSVQKIQISLMYDKYNGHITWSAVYIYMPNIPLSYSWNKKIFHSKDVEENKTHILCSINFFPRKSCRLWDNVEKYCRAGQPTDDNMAHVHCMPDT